MCRADAYDSSWEFHRQKNKKARKPHVCDECNRTIEPGEIYTDTFGKSEGDIVQHCLCQHCCVPVRWLIENCGGWVFWEVREEIEEHAVEYPEFAPPLRSIADGMLAKWAGPSGLMPMPEMPPQIEIDQ